MSSPFISLMNSDGPPQFVATTGFPQLIASIQMSENVSKREFITKKSQAYKY